MTTLAASRENPTKSLGGFCVSFDKRFTIFSSYPAGRAQFPVRVVFVIDFRSTVARTDQKNSHSVTSYVLCVSTSRRLQNALACRLYSLIRLAEVCCRRIKHCTCDVSKNHVRTNPRFTNPKKLAFIFSYKNVRKAMLVRNISSWFLLYIQCIHVKHQNKW